MTTERTAPVLYLVIPCYNEEAVLPETTKRLTEKLHTMILTGLIDRESRILYVDDGSRDQTWSLISEYSAAIPYVDGVKLAHNRGHQNALLAGLMTAAPLCDCAISMDADLQDDTDAVDRFVEKYMEGCDVVYGVRNKRDKDTFFKRSTAEGYYKFLRLLGVDIVFNHADYRLMSRRALEGLAEYKEVNLFLRGIVPLIGFKSDYVYYDRGERFAGESKYPLKKMVALALDGITSFSVKPLKLISNLGILFYNTLFDENAACHIALGAGFPNVVEGYESMTLEQVHEKGVNDSVIHVDFMIGGGTLNIDGVTADGRTVPVFRNGGWTEAFR